jgi:hypothetical protein
MSIPQTADPSAYVELMPAASETFTTFSARLGEHGWDYVTWRDAILSYHIRAWLHVAYALQSGDLDWEAVLVSQEEPTP